MLRYLTSGESHGPQLTVIIEGFPAGFRVDIERIDFQLARRQKGYGRGRRMMIEADRVRVVSGLRGGITLGSPVTFVIENKDWVNWEKTMHPLRAGDEPPVTNPRPGHADLAGAIKYDHGDIRNVIERASARETAARVAAGALARQLLEHFDVTIASHVVRIGDEAMSGPFTAGDLNRLSDKAEQSSVRCIDEDAETRMIEAIKQAGQKGETLGGVAEIIVRGLPVGLGSYAHWDRKLDGLLSAAMMSIPSVKGVEIGLGFEASSLPGSKVHDEIFYEADSNPSKKDFYRKTNNAGGIEGGISNGEDVVVRIAVKPISTLTSPLSSVDIKTKQPSSAQVERSDICVVPAIAVIGEAAAALVLADAFMDKFGSDSIADVERNYKAFRGIRF